MLYRLLAILLLTASALPPLHAQQADPLLTPECKAARVELDQASAEPASKARAARLAAARDQVAVICLGARQNRGARSGAPEPAQAVPPPVIAVPAAPPGLPTYTAPPPALAIPRPTVITTCDPAGCWDSDGRRLNNMGPLLMSPRGPCTQQAGLVNCP